MEFVAIDVETANADMASICQVGLARFVDGQLAETKSFLIDPEDWFDPYNVSIHGITEDTVEGQPTFDQVLPAIEEIVGSRLTVCHTHFDRLSINRARQAYNLAPCGWQWLDSACVARRTWPEVAAAGYGLANLAQRCGVSFRHHDAVEDARACGEILLRAISESGISLDGWLSNVKRPITPYDVKRIGSGDGPLAGERCVFTGALEMTRPEAADIAAELGADVDQGVTKKTTILIVGDQDVTRLAGHSKSGKHRKAEELIGKGFPIRIIRESDFLEIAKSIT